jgi:PadR family transcriptional regulator PadR
MSRRLSSQSLLLLQTLAEGGPRWQYGLELARTTALKSGTLYPILVRLAEGGLLESCWLEPERPGRPPRHAYRINAAGRRALVEATSRPSSLVLKGATQ